MTDLQMMSSWPRYREDPILADDGARKVHFHYTEGLDGDIEICSYPMPEHYGTDQETVVLRFPASALLEFIAECYTRPQLAKKLDEMSVKDLLTDTIIK